MAPSLKREQQSDSTGVEDRLKILPSLETGPEKPKIAMNKDRVNAGLSCLVHVLPLAGALGLLALNFSWYYVGDTISSGSIVALQFAAKLHDMMMVASLSKIFLSLMYKDLTSKQGLPFGAAFAALQITQLTYLVSSELWGSMISKSYGIWFKLRIGLYIFFFGLVIAVVGPASAASMIPRQNLWTFQKSYIAVNGTFDDIFPSNLSETSYDNISCVGDNPLDITPPGSCQWSHNAVTSYALLSLVPVLKNLTFELVYSNNLDHAWITGTGAWSSMISQIPFTLSLQVYQNLEGVDFLGSATSIQAQSLQGMANLMEKDALYYGLKSSAIEIQGAMDAYSLVKCFPNNSVSWTVSDPLPLLSFPVGSKQFNVTNYLSDLERRRLEYQYNANGLYYNDFVFVELGTGDTAGIAWIQSVGWPDPPPVVEISPCTVDLGWYATRVRSEGFAVTSEGPPHPNSSTIRPVHVNKEWLTTANPFLKVVNTTAFAYIADSMDTFPGASVDGPAIMSALVAVTLSAMSPVSRPYYSPASLPYSLSAPDHYLWGYDFTGYNASGPDVYPSNASFYPMHFPLTFYRSGYGYGPDSTVICLSLAILIVYCVVVVAHTLITFVLGISTSAWNSLNEVISLALNSHPALELQNTCAGIMRSRTFEHAVRVAATTGALLEDGPIRKTDEPFEPVGRHLELLFPSQAQHSISEVQINHKYGALKVKVE